MIVNETGCQQSKDIYLCHSEFYRKYTVNMVSFNPSLTSKGKILFCINSRLCFKRLLMLLCSKIRVQQMSTDAVFIWISATCIDTNTLYYCGHIVVTNLTYYVYLHVLISWFTFSKFAYATYENSRQ